MNSRMVASVAQRFTKMLLGMAAPESCNGSKKCHFVDLMAMI